MKNVMKKAWEIARKGQKQFGGKVSEYLSEALKMAWAIIKKGAVKMGIVELRAEEIAKEHIATTGGNADTEFYAKSNAEKEYSDLIGNMMQINKVTGKEMIKIDAFKNKLNEMNLEQYHVITKKVNQMLLNVRG